MFNFYSLYSGSSGNSLLVETSNTKILIDAGESAKKITSALSSLDIEPSQINAILVTHEHSDHVKGLGTFSKKYNIPVFANSKTLDAMTEQVAKISENNIKKFTVEEKFEIGDLKIFPFKIPHDAANPCGFNIVYNNNKILEYNKLIKDMADRKGIKYIDLCPALTDENGCLPEEASTDGIHLNKEYCIKWLNCLK